MFAAFSAAALAACASEPLAEPIEPVTIKPETVTEEPPAYTAGFPDADMATAGSGVLDGSIWTVISLNGAVVPEANAPTLAFQGPGVTGSTGCNRYFGQVSVTENGVTFAPMGVSRRACAPEIMDLENDFLAALRQVDGFALHGDARLEISTGQQTAIEARRAP